MTRLLDYWTCSILKSLNNFFFMQKHFDLNNGFYFKNFLSFFFPYLLNLPMFICILIYTLKNWHPLKKKLISFPIINLWITFKHFKKEENSKVFLEHVNVLSFWSRSISREYSCEHFKTLLITACTPTKQNWSILIDLQGY